MTHSYWNRNKLLLIGAAAVLLPPSWSTLADETYIVVAGDTACEIAEQFAIPCVELLETNQLSKEAIIVVGQQLVLPGTRSGSGTPVEVLPVEPEEILPTQDVSPKPEELPVEPEEILPTQDVSPKPEELSAEPNSSSETDLWSVYILARAHDPIFAAQRLRLDAAHQALPQARAASRPQLSFDSSLNRSYDDDFDHSDSLQSSISLSQSLYNRSSRLGVQQARHRIAAAQATYQEADQDLILRVARAYFAVLAMRDNLELSEKNQAAIGRQLELALERLNAGLGTRTDLFDAESRYESAVADGIDAAKHLDDASQDLMLLTSNRPGVLRTVRRGARLTSPEPNEPGPWIDAALQNNHRLVAEKHTLSVTRLDAARQQAARWPTLGASLSGSFTDAEQTDSTRTSVSLRLSVPLLQGGLVQSRIKEAVLNLKVAQYNHESSRRQVHAETRGTFLSISSRSRRIEALTQAMRAGEGALRAKEEGFAAGLNTNIEVLDGQRDLFRAERDYLKERYDYILDILQLDALTGDLNSDDLRRVNAWLN
jgi:outer membrane protein